MENIRILIVDDQSAMRAFIKASIKVSFPSGIDIAEAGSGETAQTILSVSPCDIVICDWNMPGMKGTELLTWVKEEDGLKDTQFLMLTASHDKDLVMNSIKIGVSDFIMKPVSADTLSQRVQAALDRILISRRNKSGGSHQSGDGIA